MPKRDGEPPPEVPELDPPPPLELPELDTPPEEEAAASLSGELSLVELLPHALASAARHARHPVSAEWRRTPVVAVSMPTPFPSCSDSIRPRASPLKDSSSGRRTPL